KLSDSTTAVQSSGSRKLTDYSSSASDTITPNYATAIDNSLVAPTAMQYVSSSTSCDGDCGGCDSCSVGAACATGRHASRAFFSAEILLWFSQADSAPPLVTNSAQGVFPALDVPGVSTVLGGEDGISWGLLPGYRIEGGLMLDECGKFGVSGRVFGNFEDEETFRQSSDGSTSIGIPFYNANPAFLLEDAYLVAFTAPNGEPVSEGSVYSRSDLNMLTAEASLRILLGRSKDHRVDLIGGYTYSRIRSSLGLETTSVDLFTGNGIPNGTVFDTNDLFETNNEFNGGHLGVLSSVIRNRLSLTTLAKISFGNMSQSSDIRGFTVESFEGSSSTTEGGIFTQTSNIGRLEQNTFAFIPELGLKLGYHVTDHLQATVGYSFVMWSSVAMAGEQIDRTVDLVQTASRPTALLNDTSFWMQGIDLGLSYSF
ncbi:MAG: BBP7 family outer membrane beta-barrel protein, partial [bacterium]|nr:BBP7 family outer membrane beta-barrel protein [bacterium]